MKKRKRKKIIETSRKNTLFFYESRPVQSWNILPHLSVNQYVPGSSFCMLLKTNPKKATYSLSIDADLQSRNDKNDTTLATILTIIDNGEKLLL